MSEIILPRWNSRHDLSREDRSPNFSDIAGVMVNNFYFYEILYNAVAPYEARQRDVDEDGQRNSPYVPLTVNQLKEMIRKPAFISKEIYDGALRGISEWCALNQGNFALPVPHPTTIHSIQLPKGTFNLTRNGDTHTLEISGCKARFYIQKLSNAAKIKHLIVRPKSNASGTPNLAIWEVLTFNDDFGYIPLWVDSTANPRFAGTI